MFNQKYSNSSIENEKYAFITNLGTACNKNLYNYISRRCATIRLIIILCLRLQTVIYLKVKNICTQCTYLSYLELNTFF